MSKANAISLHSMWGFSPAKNLLESVHVSRVLKKGHPPLSENPINVLLLNPCDIRHIIKTITEREDAKENILRRPIHFYLVENCMEVLARDLLLLQVFLDFKIPIRQRATLFLEIFGNALVQEKTEAHIENTGRFLIDVLCGSGEIEVSPNLLAQLIDLSFLKFRDRDLLESVFQAWDSSTDFNVAELRDHRLRNYYAERYDCRANVLDWDYQSRVKEIASIIHQKQYRYWRMKGVAFEYGDCNYIMPNRSCASSIECMMKSGENRGIKQQVKGYWLDILVGPFVAFGVDSNREKPFVNDLFHIVNEGTGCAQHRHHSIEVATYNVVDMMYELQHRKQYKMKQKGEIYSGLGGDEPTANPAIEVLTDEVSKDDNSNEDSFKIINQKLQDIKVYPMGTNMKTILRKKKFNDFFDVVFVSQQSTHLLKGEGFSNILTTNAEVIMETGKYIFALTSTQQDNLLKNMKALAAEIGLKEIECIENETKKCEQSLRNGDFIYFTNNTSE